MSETLLADAFVGYPEELAIFEKPIQNVGVRRSHCTTFYPVNDFSSQGVIQFAIANNSNCYVDLRKTQLNITCKIVARDSDIVETPKVAAAQPAAAATAGTASMQADRNLISVTCVSLNTPCSMHPRKNRHCWCC